MNNKIIVSAIFDPTLNNKIELGDSLNSINNIPINQLYQDFSKFVYASTPQQREMKITQKLLYLAKEAWGDSLMLTFKNNENSYTVCLNELNFVGKKRIPDDFKLSTDNLIEKYNDIVYLRSSFEESRDIPFIYSYMNDFNKCKGMILDLRGIPGGGHSTSSFFSFLISENSLLGRLGSSKFSSSSDLIVKPSKQIHVQAPLVVLIDARTTCYPELLINALRKSRSDVFVMGTSNSSGSAQYVARTDLPRNAILAHFHGTTIDAFGQLIDNNIGIIPDVLVRFNSYKDLFPYSDKLKYLAIQYLGNILEKDINNN
jgi:hypothetical protein